MPIHSFQWSVGTERETFNNGNQQNDVFLKPLSWDFFGSHERVDTRPPWTPGLSLTDDIVIVNNAFRNYFGQENELVVSTAVPWNTQSQTDWPIHITNLKQVGSGFQITVRQWDLFTKFPSFNGQWLVKIPGLSDIQDILQGTPSHFLLGANHHGSSGVLIGTPTQAGIEPLTYAAWDIQANSWRYGVGSNFYLRTGTNRQILPPAGPFPGSGQTTVELSPGSVSDAWLWRRQNFNVSLLTGLVFQAAQAGTWFGVPEIPWKVAFSWDDVEEEDDFSYKLRMIWKDIDGNKISTQTESGQVPKVSKSGDTNFHLREGTLSPQIPANAASYDLQFRETYIGVGGSQRYANVKRPIDTLAFPMEDNTGKLMPAYGVPEEFA